MKQMKKLLSFILVAAFALSLTGPIHTMAATFRDIRGHWSESYVKSGVNRGYINGYEDGTFKPDKAVSRAEFCKMVNNALGVTKSESIGFEDVPGAAWYVDEVRRAVAAGYINGYEDNTFKADNKISRQEAAVVLSRIMAPPSSADNMSAMKDRNAIASWALEEARCVYAKGYMTGDQNKNFRPEGNLTRGEAAKIIEAVLGKETIVKTNLNINTSGSKYSNTIYMGDVTIGSGVGSNGTVSFSNCRVLGTTTVTGGDTLYLENSGMNKLVVNNSSDKAEIQLSGYSSVRNTTATRGCTLKETGLSGRGFHNVTLSGASLKHTEVNLDGRFNNVDLNSQTDLNLTSGTISRLTVATGAGSSEINLARGTRVLLAQVNAACAFKGAGNITKATVGNSKVTFETQPDELNGMVAMVPNITPKNGAKDVSVGSSITLVYSDALLNSAGRSLTSSMVEDDVIELRRDKENGSSVAFSASVTNSRKTITIEPDSDLKKDTTYYLIISNRAMKNSDGVYNTRQVYSFTTVGSMSPATYPVDGSDTIPIGTKITLKFTDSLLRGDNNGSLTADYLQKTALELRRDRAAGTAVDFTAKLESDKKTITISPKEDLKLDTTYYITLAEGSLANNDKDKNKEIIFSFETADTDVLVPQMDPPSGSEEVSRSGAITLTYDKALYTKNGGTDVDEDYLEDDAFTLHRGSSSGTTAAFSASIDRSRKVVTIEPDSDLRGDTTYYLVMEEGMLSDASSSSRERNDELVFNFTTRSDSSGTLEPSVAPKDGASGFALDGTVVLTFDDDIRTASNGNMSTGYLQSSVIELRKDTSDGEKVSFSASLPEKNVVNIKPSKKLEPNTRYYIILKANSIANADGEKNSRFTSYLRTGTGVALQATMSPPHESIGVSPTADITLSFDESVYNASGSSLKSSYVESTAVKLYEGSVSTKNSKSFDASVSGRSITIDPDDKMTKGKEYYVVIGKETLANHDGLKNSEQTLKFTVGSGLSLNITPARNATGVSRSDTVRLEFSEKLYRSGGTELNLSNAGHVSYVKEKVQLKAGSGVVDYTPSLSGSGRTLVLTPVDTMAGNTRHTVTVTANAFLGISGGSNDELTSYFTTANDGTGATMTEPKSTTGVSPGTAITISFQEAMSGSSRNTLTGDDVVNAVNIRKSSETGEFVSITEKNVTVASDRRSFTIRPTSNLERGVTHYVVLKDGVLKNSSGSSNKGATFRFTVESSTAISATVSNPSYGDNQITLTFNTNVTDKDGKTLSSDYAKTNFTVKEAGSVIDPASVSVSGRSVTFTLDKPISPNTAYNISVPSGCVKSGSAANGAISVGFTTRDMALDVDVVVNEQASSAEVTVNYDFPGRFDVKVTGSRVNQELEDGFTPTSGKGSFSRTATDLKAGTTYTVEVQCTHAGGVKKAEKSFTIKARSSDTALSQVTATSTAGSWTWDGPGTPSLSVPAGDYSIAAEAMDPAATVTIQNEAVTVAEAAVKVSIKVTAEDGTEKTHTLTLTPKK